DGALYVADMYRREIDHPIYVPEEARGAMDFRSGKDRGRIYRVVSDAHPAATKPDFSPAGLVHELDSPESWRRDTALRLLLERGESNPVSALEKTALAARHPEARVRARWALQVQGK